MRNGLLMLVSAILLGLLSAKAVSSPVVPVILHQGPKTGAMLDGLAKCDQKLALPDSLMRHGVKLNHANIKFAYPEQVETVRFHGNDPANLEQTASGLFLTHGSKYRLVPAVDLGSLRLIQVSELVSTGAQGGMVQIGFYFDTTVPPKLVEDMQQQGHGTKFIVRGNLLMCTRAVK